MRALAAGLAVLLAAACSGPSATPPPGAISVVTTTTVFADLVRQVGGDHVWANSLVPAGGEPHTFEPAPSDAAMVDGAQLLVMNGLGLDDWLQSFVQGAGASDTPVLQLASLLTDDPRVEQNDENPHLWMDVAYTRRYVTEIRDKLIELDPHNADAYRANAAAYDGSLAELDAWIRAQYADLPPDKRQVIAFHDAFPYYAAAYGLDTLGVIVEAPGQDPSAAQIARLITAVEQNGVDVILAEQQFSDRLAQVIAADTGAKVVSDLYTGSLGNPPLDSYTAMMRYDTSRIIEALQ